MLAGDDRSLAGDSARGLIARGRAAAAKALAGREHGLASAPKQESRVPQRGATLTVVTAPHLRTPRAYRRGLVAYPLAARRSFRVRARSVPHCVPYAREPGRLRPGLRNAVPANNDLTDAGVLYEGEGGVNGVVFADAGSRDDDPSRPQATGRCMSHGGDGAPVGPAGTCSTAATVRRPTARKEEHLRSPPKELASGLQLRLVPGDIVRGGEATAWDGAPEPSGRALRRSRPVGEVDSLTT
jgi:hypothetical protein